MLWVRIELATSLRSCLSQLFHHAELWLPVVQQKSFNAIPHNFEKRCNIKSDSVSSIEVLRQFCIVGNNVEREVIHMHL
jgi:hypothetical protein